jgi:hypothetical protein
LTSEEPSTGNGTGAAGARRLAVAARRVVMGVGLVLYTLLFAEGFLRVFDPQAVMPRYITSTAWGVRGNIPHARYWHHTPEVDVQYRINGQGLRADQDFSLAKPAGLCRMGIFGDSFMFGLESDLRDTFAYQLEKRLRERGIPVQVLNFAVGGFGTAEMLRTYEAFGRKFDLDVALFSWDISDLNDNVRSQLFRLHDDALEPANPAYLPAVDFQDRLMQHSLYRFVNDHSQLYTFVRDQASRLAKARMTRAGKQDAAAADADGAGAEESVDLDELQHKNVLALSTAILQRAHDVVTADGEDFYLLDIPARLSRTRFSSSIAVLPAASLANLNVIQVLPALSRAARPDLKLYYEKGLGHFTPVGTQILVDQAVIALASSPRLAACATRGAENAVIRASASGAAVPPPRPEEPP